MRGEELDGVEAVFYGDAHVERDAFEDDDEPDEETKLPFAVFLFCGKEGGERAPGPSLSKRHGAEAPGPREGALA